MDSFRNVFPNLSILASYNPITQIISFEEMKRSEYERAIEDPLSIDHIENSTLIAHETSHYIDNVATLHGQQMLLDVYNAFNAFESKNEANFFHIINLYRTLRKNKYESYYKEYISNSVVTDTKHDNWSFLNTIGLGYNNEGKSDVNLPIIFNHFKFRGSPVARIPLSVESLWESSAVATELSLYHNHTTLLANEDDRIVSNNLYRKKYNDWIYNPELLTYSAAAHIVSSRLKIGDLVQAFNLTKFLIWLSLNMTNRRAVQIKFPTLIGINPKWLSTFKRINDPSRIFYQMVINLQQSRESFDNEIIDIERILFINGLPKITVMESEIERAFELIGRDINAGSFKSHYKDLNNNGKRLFKEIGLNINRFSLSYPNFSRNIMTICGINELLDSSNSGMVRHNEIDFFLGKFKEFVEACR